MAQILGPTPGEDAIEPESFEVTVTADAAAPGERVSATELYGNKHHHAEVKWSAERGPYPRRGQRGLLVISDAGEPWLVSWGAGLMPDVDKIATHLLQSETDELSVSMVNALRRSVQIRYPFGGIRYPGAPELFEGQSMNVDGERINTTSAGKALEFLALYAAEPPQRPEFVAQVEAVANTLLGYQWVDDPTSMRYGGWKLADADTRASAFGAAVNGKAMLAMYRLLKKPKYATAAKRTADFLVRLSDPNTYWFPKYGVNPINRTVGGVTWRGICDRVNGADGLSTTCTTWNLIAAEFLLRMFELTGIAQYQTAALEARDFMAQAVIDGYDFFAVSTNPDPTYAFVAWTNDTGQVWNDHALHRLGDAVQTGTVGTDQTEYGMWALLALGFDPVQLAAAYRYYRNLKYPDAGSFQDKYNANDMGGVCWPGFWRLGNAVNAPGPDRPYGTYFDSQGAGTTLPVKRALAEDDYRRTVELIINHITEHGSLLNENLDTKWSTDAISNYATEGAIPMAEAGLGALR